MAKDRGRWVGIAIFAEDDGDDPCGCLAAAVDPHTPDEHTTCGVEPLSRNACGSCDGCVSVRMAEARRG